MHKTTLLLIALLGCGEREAYPCFAPDPATARAAAEACLKAATQNFPAGDLEDVVANCTEQGLVTSLTVPGFVYSRSMGPCLSCATAVTPSERKACATLEANLNPRRN